MSKKIIATDHLHVAKNLVEMYKGKEDYNSEKISGVLDYNLEKGIIDDDQFCNAKDQLDTIEKGRGKTKKIGELDKSGRNIKTANGWVPVKHAAKTHAGAAEAIAKKQAAGLDISNYGLDEYHKIIDSAVKSRKGFYTGSGYDTDVDLYEERKAWGESSRKTYAILNLFHPRNNFKYALGQQDTLATKVLMETTNGKTWKKVEEQVIGHGYGGQVLKGKMGRIDSAYNGNDYNKLRLSPTWIKHRENKAAETKEKAEFKNDLLSKIPFDSKDEARIKNIIARSKGSDNSAMSFAQSMANSIKDPNKAIQRASAAHSLGHGRIADIFLEEAFNLGYVYEEPYSPKKRKRDGEPKNYGRPSPILPIGKINLNTGSSKYFNVYETWGEDSTYEIYKDLNSGWSDGSKKNYKIVVTSGKSPINDVGDKAGFIHDQNHRGLFDGEMIDHATGSELKRLAATYGNSISGYVYK